MVLTEEAATVYVDKTLQELESLRTFQTSLLSTLRQTVVLLDDSEVVRVANDAALALSGSSREELLGKKLQDTALARRCPDILSSLQRVITNSLEQLQVRVRIEVDAERDIMFTLRSLTNSEGIRTGTLIYAEEVSAQEKLRNTIEELEAAAEELRSANEELDATNKELQSINEELKTTNKELLTTNEQLHSLVEPLEITNDELGMPTREVHESDRRYAHRTAEKKTVAKKRLGKNNYIEKNPHHRG
ncbi:MAG TPA: PAS domain-containing protein [Terriglobales bacterium]|nr:PAS domain-containing protein [Terriglobales bacterium]